MQKKILTAALLAFMVLAACGKKAEDRPAAETPAPFSKGPSGPPVISQPTQPSLK